MSIDYELYKSILEEINHQLQDRLSDKTQASLAACIAEKMKPKKKAVTMDVLIGRIKARIMGCEDIIKSSGMPDSTKRIAGERIDTYRDVLKDIKEITKNLKSG